MDGLNGKIAFTKEEAARLAGVSSPTMLEWLRRDDFPAFKVGTRWVIPRSALEDWLNKKALARADM